MKINTRKLKNSLSLVSYYMDKVKPIMMSIPNKNDTVFSGTSKVITGLSSLGKDWFNLEPTLHNMANQNNLKSRNFFPQVLELKIPIYEKSIRNHSFSYKESNYNDLFKIYSGSHMVGDDDEDKYEVDGGYYFDSEKDIDTFLNLFWDQYGGACTLNLLQSPKLKPLTISKSPLYGQTLDVIENLKSEIEFFKNHDVVRTWLFLGLPGLGKTRIACELAQRTGGRLIHVVAKYFNDSAIEKIANMKPNIVLLDDVDSMHGEYFLNAFERMRDYKINLLLTANSLSNMNEAILRPGRIDKIIKFKLPDEADRLKLIKGFRDEYGITDKIPDELTEELSKLTIGMSQAYIREIVTRLRYEPYKTVLQSLEDIKDLLNSKRSEDIFRKPNLNQVGPI